MIWARPSLLARALAFALATLSATSLDGLARAEPADGDAREVRVAPSRAGTLGAWLVAGPFKAAGAAFGTALAGVDEAKLAFVKGAALGGERDLGRGKRRPPAAWQVVSSGPPRTGGRAQDPGIVGSRTVDLRASLDDADGTDLVAYAAARVHVTEGGRHYLLLGVDDGVRVTVDGAVVFARDDARPVRDDDDVIPLDLAAGDHDLVLALHQRAGAWAFRARLVDASFAAPRGSYAVLPGATDDDARELAARMSWVVVDRAFDAASGRYRPTLTVRYPEGAPLGVDLTVSARLTGTPPAIAFDLSAGRVRVGSAGAEDLVIALPAVDPLPSGTTATLETRVAGRLVSSVLPARPAAERALVRVARALAGVAGDEPWLRSGSLDSVSHLARRLTRALARGDADVEAQAEEARELEARADGLERRVDPYDGRAGMMRRALLTPFDGGPSEVGVYVPESWARRPSGATRRYPLVVGLHGMRSGPMSMMRALFGLDDPKKPASWKDRHFMPGGSSAIPPVDAFVITPDAHGDSMYRGIGEEDVLHMVDWARRAFPIDESRITITGPSMGGIGSASLPFHFPHVFAASAPLCGYHSYLIRPDIASRPMRPWERLLLEERSNVYWAENGEHLPLWIVHGTRDLPVANSDVLIERYEKLGYSIKHDHPEAGHDVWGITYGELKGMRWLLSQRLDRHPRRVRHRTMRARYGTSAWVTVDELASEAAWAEVDARAKDRSTLVVTTSGVAALTLRRDERLVARDAPVNVTVDGAPLAFEPDEPIVLHRPRGGRWTKGEAAHARPVKRGHVTGPIRDVFHEPVVFVYAADAEARVNERVARGLSSRPGVTASYPVLSDAEFLARGEPLANERALFLVGRNNRVLTGLAAAAEEAGAALPMHFEDGRVTLGRERFTGTELGGAFIHPNPLRPDRYVVVVAGADGPGMLRALSLPDLLPDFVVWDRALAPARGQLLLGHASLLAGGFFTTEWALPARTADPRATPPRAPPAHSPAAEPEDDEGP